MTSHIIDVNDCGGAVTWTQGLVPKLASRVEIMGVGPRQS
jgi:hypothetical protein